MKPLLEWLVDPANFAEGLFSMDGRPVTLDAWQAGYLSSPARFTVILKSRRVGGSWAMTARMFIRSQIVPRYSGVFISMNREEARGKIDYADEMHDSMPRRFRLKRIQRSKDEIAFVDAAGRRSALKSLAAKAPRGRGGDVGISELPHCLNARDIYEGALHVTARDESHQLTIESTPLGKGGVFYDLCRGKYPQFHRREVPWWQCAALCVDVRAAAAEAPAMATGERVARFGTPAFQSIYASMPEPAFRQESELAFIEMENAAFSMALIMSCAEPEYDDAPNAPLKYRKVERVPTDADWAWLGRCRVGTLTAGYDPARTRDRAALAILDVTGERIELRMAVAMRGEPFARQKKVVEAALRSGVTALRIDATGLGMDISERLECEWPGVVKGVQFTARLKQKMVSGVHNAFTGRTLAIPADRGLVAQLGSIREVVSDSGRTLYRSPSGVDGHADLAWALLLAFEAARGVAGGAGPRYESVSRRAVWTV